MQTEKAKNLLMPMLQNLIDTEYRFGFEDSVLSRCRNLLNKHGLSDEARNVWNKKCCGDTQGAFFNDEELVAKYQEAEVESAKEGCFQMPHWGTHGT